jgi:hypothetical protein
MVCVICTCDSVDMSKCSTIAHRAQHQTIAVHKISRITNRATHRTRYFAQHSSTSGTLRQTDSDAYRLQEAKCQFILLSKVPQSSYSSCPIDYTVWHNNQANEKQEQREVIITLGAFPVIVFNAACNDVMIADSVLRLAVAFVQQPRIMSFTSLRQSFPN